MDSVLADPAYNYTVKPNEQPQQPLNLAVEKRNHLKFQEGSDEIPQINYFGTFPLS